MASSKRAADFSPNKNDLNPIEIASRDEIAALQLRRMKWSLKHAYENVPHYKKSFDAAGVHPDDLKDLSDLRKFPLHDEGRSARELSLWDVRGADGQDRAHSCLVGHDRQADGRRLHQARYPHLGRCLRAQHRGERRPAAG